MNGIAALVGHVDEIVALFDDMFEGPLSPVELPAFKRSHESCSETWEERFDGVASVFVLWTWTKPEGLPGEWTRPGERIDRTKPRAGWSPPAIAFHGAPPKQWTPARAEHEARWASRDAIVNAIGKARQEGATGRAIAGRVADVYGGWLELRARLVDGDALRGAVAAALRDAMAAGTLAENAVNTLRHELGRLFDDGFRESPGDYGHCGFNTAEYWRTLHRLYLRPALENARVYADAIGQRESAGRPGASVSSPVSTQAEAVDDEGSRARRKMPDNARSVVRFLRDKEALERPLGFTIPELAVELGLTPGEVKGAFKWLRKHRAKPKHYEAVPGRNGRHWLTPAGKVFADGIDADTCVQLCLATAGGNRHESARA